MADTRADEVVRPSVLDRLIGGDRGTGAAHDIRVSVRELRRSVKRDLEWVLNSRIVHDEVLDGLPEARTSILTYGLPDLSAFSNSSAAHVRTICELITEAIDRFEPRLQGVQVQVLEDPDPRDDRGGGVASPSHHAQLRFRIEAVLHVDPVLEPVSFDTTMDADRGEVRVEESD